MRSSVRVVVLSLLAVHAAAQNVTPELARVEASCDAEDWRGALDAALALRDRVVENDDVERLAGLLARIGNEGRAPERAVRAFEGLLALQRRARGAGDHPEVVVALEDLAFSLHSVGRSSESLPLLEEALATKRRIVGEATNHAGVAATMTNLGACLAVLGQVERALEMHRSALAMRRRLFGEIDHPDIATSLSHIGGALQRLDRSRDALAAAEEALAMRRRLAGDDDEDLAVVESLNNSAYALKELGRFAEAMQRFEAAFATLARIRAAADDENLAITANNLGLCLQALGRADEARQRFEAAIAMWERLAPGRDHSMLATFRGNLAICLASLGRPTEALVLHELALAMRRRIFGNVDHPEIAGALSDIAVCLEELGRVADALEGHVAALEMKRRLLGDDSLDVAHARHNVGNCLSLLGRDHEALVALSSSLETRVRLLGSDHPEVAVGRATLAACLRGLGRNDEALGHAQSAVDAWRRILGGADHLDLCRALTEVGNAALLLGKPDVALPALEAALAMRSRITGDPDDASTVTLLGNIALALQRLGRVDAARETAERGCAMAERVRTGARISVGVRQSFFDHMKRSGTFEILQALTADDPEAAFRVAERSRGRDLLDMMAQERCDPFAAAVRDAEQRGDAATAKRLRDLERELTATDLAADELLHRLADVPTDAVDDASRASRRDELTARSRETAEHRRQLLDERARLLGDALALGRTREPAEIRAALRKDELLLEYTVTEQAAIVYVMSPEGVDAVRLPKAFAAVRDLLPGMLSQDSRRQLDTRGRDGAAIDPGTARTTDLFDALMPTQVWERVRRMRRVFLAAHRELHRLPFEALTTGVVDGKPVPWIDQGPPIAYVPSGSALCRVRERPPAAVDDPETLDALVIGEPGAFHAGVPHHGALVVAVIDGGEGARAGLRAGDVLLRYGEHDVADDRALAVARDAVAADVAAGRRANDPVPLLVWRAGEDVRSSVAPGRLGLEIAPGGPRSAMARDAAGVARVGDLERIRDLPPLRGARDEAIAIAKVFRERGRRATLLLGDDATETRVFDLAARATFLHFACHGIAEEYAGDSLSMLVLRQRPEVLPGDDGLLKSTDLQRAWLGRLSSTRLVVLSACSTTVGTTCRDEAPRALPIGFLTAGARAVISSLWAVDDESTRELMTDFYGRLLAGEPDCLAAFTAAKKALRAKHAASFHWAPFLFMGSPE